MTESTCEQNKGRLLYQLDVYKKNLARSLEKKIGAKK